jgi:hypothetical protein
MRVRQLLFTPATAGGLDWASMVFTSNRPDSHVAASDTDTPGALEENVMESYTSWNLTSHVKSVCMNRYACPVLTLWECLFIAVLVCHGVRILVIRPSGVC